MSDTWLEHRRRRAVRTLGDRYSRGELSTSTFEGRLDLALRAESNLSVSALLWDLARPLPWLRIDALVTPSGVLESDAARRAWIVGRSSRCDVQVPDTYVSGQHARISKRGLLWSIEDLGSTNGTWLNGRQVKASVVRPGDVIALGTGSARVTVEGRTWWWERQGRRKRDADPRVWR